MKSFRKGQKVSSVYNPDREFVIDRVIQPDMIYHERGSNRWWSKSELRAVLEAKRPVTASKLQAAKDSRSQAFIGNPAKQGRRRNKTYKRTCRFCGTEFLAARPEAEFCPPIEGKPSCRMQDWKLRNEAPAVPKVRLRSEPEHEESLGDT
jgi:hypothetical protein